jgi:hypothetical protein
VSADARATHTCSSVDGVCRVVKNDFAYPTACTLRFQFAARDDRPALELFWHDGGMQPRLPEELEKQDVAMGAEGILYVGDEGVIMAGFLGQEPQLFAKGQRQPLALDDDSARDTARGSRQAGWVSACQGGEPSPGRFENAAAITDAVNLGTVALRAGCKVTFDSQGMQVTNAPDANAYLRRNYRDGWQL